MQSIQEGICMKITFVMIGLSLCGGDRVIATHADRLRKKGHDVLVVASGIDKPSVKEGLRSLLKGHGWISQPSKTESHIDNMNVPYMQLDRFRPIVDADVPDADVVIATWWQTAEWVANLSPQKGAKVYFIQHHEVFDYLPEQRVRATYTLPLSKITISKWLIDLMRTEYNDDNVSLVSNSVDTKQFYAPLRGRQDIPTVGMLYAPAHWKGCDISLEAFLIAAKSIPGLRLIAFGTGTISDHMLLPEGAEYFQSPAQDKIKDIYARCDVWLCGSRSEGFCLPPLEAMACRCPVVSTAVGGLITLIEDGINGYLLPIDDTEGLAQGLVDVLALPVAKWQEMSDAAYATATQYTWDDAADLFEAALYNIVSKKPPATVAATS
jgi:glycosyltransferase involved in cell wall biosynthesis